MRITAVLIIALIAGSAFAAEISGHVYVKGQGWKELQVGYVGRDASGKQLDCMAGATRLMDGEGMVSCDTFKPRVTRMEWNDGSGCSFKHTNLPPGEYIVYARSGEYYFKWKVINIKSASARVSVNFSITPSDSGALKLVLPSKKGDYNIVFTPINPSIARLVRSFNSTSSFSSDLDAKGGTVLIKGFSPGTYRVEVRNAYRQGDKKNGYFTTYNTVGTTTIAVKSRTGLVYRVP